jgi:hypothetical protein
LAHRITAAVAENRLKRWCGGDCSFAFHKPNVTVPSDFPTRSVNHCGLNQAKGGTE